MSFLTGKTAKKSKPSPTEAMFDEYFELKAAADAAKAALEAIQNDAQIKALNNRLNDLLQHQSPKYVLKTNGDFELVYGEEFNRLFEKITQEIKHRQSQIMSAYNWR